MNASIPLNSYKNSYLDTNRSLGMMEFLLLMGTKLLTIINIWQLFAIGTFAVTISDVGCIFYILYVVKRLVWDGEPLVYVFDWTLIFFLLFLVSIFISYTNVLPRSESSLTVQFFKSTSHQLYLLVFTLFVWGRRIPIEFFEKYFRYLLYFSIVINIYALYQTPARAFDLPLAYIVPTNVSLMGRGGESELVQIVLSFEGFFRATSIFSEPSTLAAFNSTIIYILLFPTIIQSKNPLIESKLLYNTMLFLAVVGLFLTFSLTGVVMTIGGLFLLSLLSNNRKSQKLLLIYSVAIILVIILADKVIASYANISIAELYTQRITSLLGIGGKSEYVVGESFDTRYDAILIAKQIWSQFPLFGIGTGLFSSHLIAKQNDVMFSSSAIYESLACHGLFGLVTFLGICLFPIHTYLTVLVTTIKRHKATVEKFLSDYQGRVFTLMVIFSSISLLNFLQTFTSNSYISFGFWSEIATLMSFLQLVILSQNPNEKVMRIYLVQTPWKQIYRSALAQQS